VGTDQAGDSAGTSAQKRVFTREWTTLGGVTTTEHEDAPEHYLRQIRNGVVFLSVLAGVGALAVVVEGALIAAKLMAI